MTKASQILVDDLPPLWELDIDSEQRILQLLWNYYGSVAERGLTKQNGDLKQERLAYIAHLAAWQQLFECIDQFVPDEISGVWKILLKEETPQ